MTQIATVSARPRRSVSLDLDSPELASTYDQVSVRQFNHGKILVGSLRLKPGERVLEIGSGGDRLRAHVAGIVAPGGDAIRIDAASLRAEWGARALTELEAASFDVVYLNGSFQRLTDKAAVLREAQRVLSPRGRVGVNGSNAERAHQGAALLRQALLEEGVSDAAFACGLVENPRVDAQELTRMLDAAGFSQIQIAAHTFVDAISGVDEVFAWRSCSLPHGGRLQLDASQRTRVRDRLARKLEALRAPAGILLERYLVFATAQKR
jgi:arsenite methyltransferase